MVNTFSLEEEQDRPTFSILAPTQVNSPAFKDEASEKHNIALGELSPGVPTIRATLEADGMERYERLLAQKREVELANARNDIVQQIATANDRPITSVDLEVLRGLSEEQLVSPNLTSILEDEYARKYTELAALLHNEENESYDNALDANGILTEDIMAHVQGQATRNLNAQKLLDEVNTRFNAPGDDWLARQGVAWGQLLVPFLGWVQTNTMTDSPDNAFLSGDSLEKQFSYLNSLQPDQQMEVLRAAVENQIKMGNYLGAMSFLQNYLSYSPTDAFIENVLNVVDVGTSGAIGAFARGIKGVPKAVLRSPKDTVGMALDVGLDAEAAKIKVAEGLLSNSLPGTNIRNISDIENVLPSLARPQEAFTGIKLRAGAEYLNRVALASMQRAAKAMDTFAGVNKVSRLTPEAIEVGMEETEKALWKDFNHANHNIVKVSRTYADNISNLNSVTVSFGKRDGTAYASKLAAQKAAKNWFQLKTDDYDVVQTEAGWVINVTRNVDETTDAVRAVEIETLGKSPDNVWTRSLGFLLGANLKLTSSQATARAVAVQSAEQMGRVLEPFTAPFKALKKKQRKEFETFIRSMNDAVSPEGGQVNLKTLRDFEDAWYAKFNSLPTVEQADAWSALKQIDELDYLSRTMSVYKQKAVMGIEEINFKLGDEMVNFEGKIVDDLPRGKNFSFTVVNDKGKKTYHTNRMSIKDWERVDGLLANDYKVIQAYRGFVNVGDSTSNFVLVRNFKRNRPSLKEALTQEYKTRLIPKHPYYIKQPKIKDVNGRGYYQGDVSLVNARSPKEAKFILDTLNKAVDMIKKGDRGVVKFFSENLPMFSYKDFMKRVKSGEINIDSPFVITRSGTATVDTENVALKVGSNELVVDREFDLSRGVSGKFLGHPDMNMEVYGVEKGTIMRFQEDTHLSPFDTARMSMSNLVDTNVLHDYKVKSIRDYTSEFGKFLDGTQTDFDNRGIEFILNPKYKKDITWEQRNVAEGVRTSILQLLGQKTFVERQIDMHKANIVYSINPGWVRDVTEWALERLTTTDRWMRAAAFQTKMGLFNPKQFFLQSSAAIQVISISPVHGVKGARSAFTLLNVNRANEKILPDLAEKVSGIMGFSKEETLELFQAWRRSGFANVGGDVAYLDDLKAPDVKRGATKTVLDWGTTPFNVGERTARAVAFATAYSERKAMLKGKALTRHDEAWILKRSTDLTGNMTRDSNAAWQKGYGSIFSQFMAFQARMTELYLGKSLTLAEKTRLFAGMSIMYGVPVGVGSIVGVMPFRDFVRDTLAGLGIDYDNTLLEPFIDGWASWLLEQTTGADMDIASSYGPGGLTTFSDLIKGDSDWHDILMGASGGIVMDTVEDANPFFHWLWSTLDPNSPNVGISVQDLIEPLRNISTVNNFIKWKEAMNTGKWISQNENILTQDITELEAILSAILGIEPSSVSDAFTTKDAMKRWEDHKKSEIKRMVIDYRRGIAAKREGNTKDADLLFSRVKARIIQLDLTPSETRRMFQQAVSEEPMDEAIFRQYEEMRSR